ncbi:hypothetical protein GAMM_90018 [Gammaproteobacteria bacterium]
MLPGCIDGLTYEQTTTVLQKVREVDFLNNNQKTGVQNNKIAIKAKPATAPTVTSF